MAELAEFIEKLLKNLIYLFTICVVKFNFFQSNFTFFSNLKKTVFSYWKIFFNMKNIKNLNYIHYSEN